jgi:hypothetical protein
MKHTEPKVGQLVYVFTKDIFVRVIDKEIIGGVKLFYTDNKSCYIEEQLHYITEWKPNDEIEKIFVSVIEDWLTPDNALRTNVNIYKKINKPFGKIKEQDSHDLV